MSSVRTGSLPFSRALCHHPLPCPWAAGLVRADHRLPGARLRRPAPQHPLVPGRRTRTRLLAPAAPPPAAGPLEAVRDTPCHPPNPHNPGAAPNFLQPGWASLAVALAGTGMFCGRRRRRAAVPGSCWLSSGMFVCCGSWRPCCRPCPTFCSRPMSWWPWTQQASSLVSSQEDGSGEMRLGEGCVCSPDGGMCCRGTGKHQCEAAGTSVAEGSAVAECKGGCFAPKVNFQVCKEGGCGVESWHVQGHTR